MIGRGLFVVTVLSNCVLSLPVTPSQLENEDVKVMKCIVEALADVLSRPRPLPVSEECLVTLKTDDRLVSILHHHNFLKVLQDVAVEGRQERAQQQRDAATSEPTTQTPHAADDDVADRSMLEALGGPGERSILSQKRGTGNGDGEEEKDDSLGDGESQDDSDVAEELKEKRQHDESPGSHVSVDEWSEGKAEKREEEEEDEDSEEKRVHSEEEDMIKDKKGAGSGEKRDAPRMKSKEKKFVEEDEEEKDKRAFSHRPKQEVEEEDEGEMERESKESHKRWSKRGKALQMKKKAVEEEAQQEAPHHSKEATEEEKKKRHTQRSPEEKELQMIARGGPEEEEGSASPKSEEPEIESLAAIESELENVAQKLHEMRRG
ncbi:hypothetical protein VZT92_011141 [Zoarces viviparus]|uniref:Chromogranin-A n=1 Tax=Zoarces viviparus TaxID=48416 RepID=A0AAW1FCA9_ZOAVI